VVTLFFFSLRMKAQKDEPREKLFLTLPLPPSMFLLRRGLPRLMGEEEEGTLSSLTFFFCNAFLLSRSLRSVVDAEVEGPLPPRRAFPFPGERITPRLPFVNFSPPFCLFRSAEWCGIRCETSSHPVRSRFFSSSSAYFFLHPWRCPIGTRSRP